MKFPKNATPATQANWIALQGLKLQVAESNLAQVSKTIMMFKEEIISIPPSKVDLIKAKKEVLEIYKDTEKDRIELVKFIQGEIMAAQVDDTHNELQAAKFRLKEIAIGIQSCHEQFQTLHPSYKDEHLKPYENKVKELEAEELSVQSKIKELEGLSQDDCKPLASAEAKEAHEKRNHIKNLILSKLRECGAVSIEELVSHIKRDLSQRFLSEYHDELHFSHVFEELMESGQIQRDPNNSELINLTF